MRGGDKENLGFRYPFLVEGAQVGKAMKALVDKQDPLLGPLDDVKHMLSLVLPGPPPADKEAVVQVPQGGGDAQSKAASSAPAATPKQAQAAVPAKAAAKAAEPPVKKPRT